MAAKMTMSACNVLSLEEKNAQDANKSAANISHNAQNESTTSKSGFTEAHSRGHFSLLQMLPVFAKPVIVIRAEPRPAAHRVMFNTVLKRKRIQIVFGKLPVRFFFFSQQLLAHHVGLDGQLLSYTVLRRTCKQHRHCQGD